MSNVADETSLMLGEVVRRWSSSRRTFTEREALQPLWDAGYEVPIHADTRFVLVHEGDGKRPSHWRLAHQMVANTRLLNELVAGTWDGQRLDEKLAELDAEDQRHYVFYPLDARLILTKQGILEPAEHERNVKLSRAMKASLDALAPQLFACWHEAGAEPWTLRTITDVLGQLAWLHAEMQNAWLSVRAWLLGEPHVTRVGVHYWVLIAQVPRDVRRTRLHVLPLHIPESEDTTTPIGTSAPTRHLTLVASGDESEVILRGELTTSQAHWKTTLRTINLLEGFVHVPTVVRSAYPLSVPGEEQKTVLRGMWYEDGSRFWLWMDRNKNYLYGPALADHLMWLEAGTILRVDWTPDSIVFQTLGLDEDVRAEEARLIDVEALAAMRGGQGENYRRSLQAILVAAPEGLSFAEIIIALRERQQHEVHRGTIHALLYSGGFLHKEGRWFAALDKNIGASRLRAALVETLLPAQQEQLADPLSSAEYARIRVNVIHSRLSEVVEMLRKTRKSDNPEIE